MIAQHSRSGTPEKVHKFCECNNSFPSRNVHEQPVLV
jgi:hypothetical protein